MKTITIDMLYALDACQTEVSRFIRLFGQSVEVTPEACAAVAGQFNWGWAAFNLLPSPLWDEYARQHAPLWHEYVRQCNPLWDEHNRQCAPLWDTYDRQCAPLLAEYDRQCAALFAALYLAS